MQEIVTKISNNLQEANKLIEEALTLGKEHGIPVDLGSLAHMSDDGMWYVDEAEYRQEYIIDNYGVYNVETSEYDTPELTPKQLAEVEEHMAGVREDGGYGPYGQKVLGWMSSSTNC